METISFKVDGGFITDIARTWFWDENKPYEVCEELLFNCLGGTESTRDELKWIAQQIIEGRKKLVGINEFELVDDNENTRPLSVKINNQFRKIGIEKIRTDMHDHMIAYIDPYSTVKSIKAAKEYNVNTFEQCQTWFWYEDDAIQHGYMRPWTPGEGMVLTEGDDTNLGLWLYLYPDIVYDIESETDTTPSDPDFWDALYEKIKDDSKFQSKWFRKRNENYLAVKRMNQKREDTPDIFAEDHKDVWLPANDKMTKAVQPTIELTKEWLKDNPFDKTADAAYQHKHHMFQMAYDVLTERLEAKTLTNDDRIWTLVPDEYEEWEGLIAPNGDFYSCDFGGHNVKAYHLLMAYPEKFPGIDYDNDGLKSIDASNALDDLLKQGWCATRYLPTMGYFIELPKTLRGECTKAQTDAIFDAKIKHDVPVNLSVIGY